MNYFEDNTNKIDFTQDIVLFSSYFLIFVAIVQYFLIVSSNELYFLLMPTFLIIYAFTILHNIIKQINFDETIIIKKTFKTHKLNEVSNIKFKCWRRIIFTTIIGNKDKVTGLWVDYYNDVESITDKLLKHKIEIEIKRVSLLGWIKNRVQQSGRST